jgi:alkylation response protein AidB-like acyl-CoA dehydrogenase
MSKPPAAELESFLAEVLPDPWVAAVRSGDDASLARLIADREFARSLADKVAAEGWLTAEWPIEYGGRGLDADAAVGVRRMLARWQIGTVESAVGTGWVGPAILQFGDEQQRGELLTPISRNEAFWCQLFSEPEAGSDLASLRTRGRRNGADWVIDGAKIWTSRADVATWGLAVVRTDSSVTKHAGLTCFCIRMDSPGLEMRRIRQMTGDSEFYEVRLDNVNVPDRYRLGGTGQGWEIVRAVLSFERKAGSGSGAATPGSVVGRSIEELIAEHKDLADAWTRTRLIDTWVESRLIAFNNERNAALSAADRGPIGGGAPINKVLQAEHTKRLQSLRMELRGIDAVNPRSEDYVGTTDLWAYLRVQPKTIAGGTSEVLRDQIAERALGMPRSVDPSKGVPWSEFLQGLTGSRGGKDAGSR